MNTLASAFLSTLCLTHQSQLKAMMEDLNHSPVTSYHGGESQLAEHFLSRFAELWA
jgi:hypothetical protein